MNLKLTHPHFFLLVFAHFKIGVGTLSLCATATDIVEGAPNHFERLTPMQTSISSLKS